MNTELLLTMKVVNKSTEEYHEISKIVSNSAGGVVDEVVFFLRSVGFEDAEISDSLRIHLI